MWRVGGRFERFVGSKAGGEGVGASFVVSGISLELEGEERVFPPPDGLGGVGTLCGLGGRHCRVGSGRRLQLLPPHSLRSTRPAPLHLKGRSTPFFPPFASHTRPGPVPILMFDMREERSTVQRAAVGAQGQRGTDSFAPEMALLVLLALFGNEEKRATRRRVIRK